MHITASALADHLAGQMQIYGTLSREQAARVLFRYGAHLTQEQVEHAIKVAIGRTQIVSTHAGSMLRVAERGEDE